MAYSRIEPGHSMPRLSADLASDAHLSYEGDQWLPGHSGLYPFHMLGTAESADDLI